MKMTMTEAEALGRIKMGVNVDIKRSDGKILLIDNHLDLQKIQRKKSRNIFDVFDFIYVFMYFDMDRKFSIFNLNKQIHYLSINSYWIIQNLLSRILSNCANIFIKDFDS